MRQLVLVALVTPGVFLLGTAGPVRAQYPVSPYNQYYNPYSRLPGTNPGGGPRLSPYLNFLRGGSPAANYYLGVVPEIERRRYENISQSQIQGLQLSTAAPAVNPEDADLAAPASITGHPVAFNNTTAYFGGVGPVPTPNRSLPMSSQLGPKAPTGPKAPSVPK